MNVTILRFLIALGLVGSPVMGFAVTNSQTQPVKQTSQTFSVNQNKDQNFDEDFDQSDTDQNYNPDMQERKVPQPVSVDKDKNVQDTRTVDKTVFPTVSGTDDSRGGVNKDVKPDGNVNVSSDVKRC